MTQDVFGIVGTRQAGVFRVERVVAEGGFAVVYRAIHEGFRSPVALKCLKVPEVMTDEARSLFLERFREEGELMFRLSALVPAVVRPLHVDVIQLDAGRIVPFLALEWLDGEGLDRIIDRRSHGGQAPLALRALCDLLQPAALALAQGHRLPTPDGVVAVIHRDLKPENLFVVRSGDAHTVKILDFGIARTKSAASLHAGRVTESAALDAFTPGYAAPEQWLPKRYGQVGPWTDVFGLALTMVEALSGKPAIEGDLAAMMGTTTDVGRRPTPRAEGVPVSDAVELAFARALAVDPRDRTQNIEAFWTELEETLGLPPSIRIAGTPMSARSLAVAVAAPPQPAPLRVSPAAMTMEMAAIQPAPLSARPAPSPPPSWRPVAPPPSLRPVAPPPPSSRPAALPPPSSRPAALPPPSSRPAAPPPRSVTAPEGRVASPPRPVTAPEGRAALPAARSIGSAPISFELAGPVRGPETETLAARSSDPPRRVSIAALRAELRLPVQVILAAIALSAAEWIYVGKTGEALVVGGLRPVWIAGPLALVGVALACWRIIGAL
jgi:serine/threonine-protein kinase